MPDNEPEHPPDSSGQWASARRGESTGGRSVTALPDPTARPPLASVLRELAFPLLPRTLERDLDTWRQTVSLVVMGWNLSRHEPTQDPRRIAALCDSLGVDGPQRAQLAAVLKRVVTKARAGWPDDPRRIDDAQVIEPRPGAFKVLVRETRQRG